MADVKVQLVIIVRVLFTVLCTNTNIVLTVTNIVLTVKATRQYSHQYALFCPVL